MSRRATYVVLLLVALMALAIWLCWFRVDDAWYAGPATWGHGKLKASELSYYMARISSVRDAAQTAGLRNGALRQGREEAAFVCLVIDTAAKQMWLERDGRILEEYRTDLPPSMHWRLYRSTPDGTTEMPALARLRLPLNSERRFVPEEVSYRLRLSFS